MTTKLAHYDRLWNAPLVGGAWFRHQTNATARELGISTKSDNENRQRNWRAESEVERSLSLISGGTALSENLQLDRMLDVREGRDLATVALEDIKGITVADFDWKPLVKDIDPKLDALATLIPADQHVMFVPSFQSLVTLIETGFETATPLLPLMTETSESADTRRRYQRQLGLPLGDIQKIFGPKLIDSIAITGGDPYFRTGTDVAVLFEARDAKALAVAIRTSIALSAKDEELEKLDQKIGDVSYQGFVSANRNVCSYVATLGSFVVVTNSTTQLKRIIAVYLKEAEALACLDEYRYFRERYPKSDETETALVVISDQTIRRWCSPRWRIATSRRTRAAAILSDLHAQNVNALLAGVDQPINIEVGPSVFELNRYTVSGQTALSKTYGTLEFQTPISELEFDKVSKGEKSAYRNWRRGYQSNWSNAFDPIAAKLQVSEGKLAFDLTVLPLIDNSGYDEMIGLSEGAELNPKRNSRHGKSLAWMALALNTESATLKQWANMGSSFANVNFMDWIGDAAIVYVDEDPFWIEMEKEVKTTEQQEAFFQKNLHRLPVAIQLNVKSSIRLTAFLVGMRGFIEQAAPDMTVWETLRYREMAYVKVGPSVQTRSDLPEDIDANIALYYMARGDSLIFSLSEAVNKSAIDRRLNSKDGENQSTDQVEENSAESNMMPLLGKNMVVQIKRSLGVGLLSVFDEGYQRQMQSQAWSALPILNEWKQMHPDRDPLEIDRTVWKRSLVCPGGGEYRWNDEWKTMESSVYGHPAEPKTGPHIGQMVGNWASGNFGITFENDGLRALVELNK